MNNNKKGFSLLELLVVVAIILIVASIALPNLLRSILTANEASAVGSLKTLVTASVAYSTTYGGYPTALSQLGPAIGQLTSQGNADLIDARLVSGIKSGYSFSWNPGPLDAFGRSLNYSIIAQPLYPGVTGQRTFYVDATGIIRGEVSSVANMASMPIGY